MWPRTQVWAGHTIGRSKNLLPDRKRSRGEYFFFHIEVIKKTCNFLYVYIQYPLVIIDKFLKIVSYVVNLLLFFAALLLSVRAEVEAAGRACDQQVWVWSCPGVPPSSQWLRGSLAASQLRWECSDGGQTRGHGSKCRPEQCCLHLTLCPWKVGNFINETLKICTLLM